MKGAWAFDTRKRTIISRFVCYETKEAIHWFKPLFSAFSSLTPNIISNWCVLRTLRGQLCINGFRQTRRFSGFLYLARVEGSMLAKGDKVTCSPWERALRSTHFKMPKETKGAQMGISSSWDECLPVYRSAEKQLWLFLEGRLWVWTEKRNNILG